eukprot:3244367-Pleurochrysis_carterae.AAC.2
MRASTPARARDTAQDLNAARWVARALRDEEARVRLGHDTEAFERTLVALAVRHAPAATRDKAVKEARKAAVGKAVRGEGGDSCFAPVDAVLSGAAGGDGARELGLLALLGAHEAHGGGALLCGARRERA